MTAQEFRTQAGIGAWTLEGDKIKAVQMALTAYHVAVGAKLKQQRLTELDRAVQAWREAHTPGTNWTHKARERGKRRAMDELHWQVEATCVDDNLDLVMSVSQFQALAGLTKWTLEGDKIKDVQTRLGLYHNAADAKAKSDALRRLQAAISTWRTAHVAPLNLKDRSARKMQAMDQLQWQVATLTNATEPDDLDDETAIARHLRKQVVTVHDDDNTSAPKLQQLMGMLASHYSDYVKKHQDPRGATAVRVATVDIATWDVMRLLKDKCATINDGIDDGTKEPPIMSFEPGVQVALLAYLKSLLANELRERSRVALAAAALGGKHRAQIIVDYYFARDPDQVSLHKDTYGTTLFVALHYLNMGPMTGPEYIYDRWPIAAQERYDEDGVVIAQGAWSSGHDEKVFRARAPWSKNARYDAYGQVDVAFESERARDGAAEHFWPDGLIKALEAARQKLPNAADVQMSELPPYGLISFVDELIYHSTPLTRQRDEESDNSAYRAVTTGGRTFYVGIDAKAKKKGMRLERAMSKAFESGDFEPKLGFKDKRTFLRLWITVSPQSWYTPWTQWKKR